MRLYIHFNSFHFYSFLFYSIQRDEKYETLRMITNDNEKNENYEILRNITKITKITKYYKKKRKMLLNNHVIVIFYVKTVYFFIHLKNETIEFPFFSSVSFFSFLFVICELRFLLNKSVIFVSVSFP